MKIKLINGIVYTKDQVRGMFSSQLEITKRLVMPEYKNILINWINEQRESRD